MSSLITGHNLVQPSPAEGVDYTPDPSMTAKARIGLANLAKRDRLTPAVSELLDENELPGVRWVLDEQEDA